MSHVSFRRYVVLIALERVTGVDRAAPDLITTASHLRGAVGAAA